VPTTYENPYGGKKYLEDNFSHIDPESRFMLQFFHDVYSLLPARRKLVEIGGGGALYSLISARRKVDEITYGEFNSWPRQDLERWKKADKDAHNWEVFFEETRRLEERAESTDKMVADLREKFSAIVECNIFEPHCGISTSYGSEFDIVSSQFCAESISSNSDEFDLSMRNLLSLVAPTGYLVISLLHNATYWDFADDKVFCTLVNREGMLDFLQKEGFEILLHRHSQDNAEKAEPEEFCAEAARGHNYDGLLSIAARRR